MFGKNKSLDSTSTTKPRFPHKVASKFPSLIPKRHHDHGRKADAEVETWRCVDGKKFNNVPEKTALPQNRNSGQTNLVCHDASVRSRTASEFTQPKNSQQSRVSSLRRPSYDFKISAPSNGLSPPIVAIASPRIEVLTPQDCDTPKSPSNPASPICLITPSTTTPTSPFTVSVPSTTSLCVETPGSVSTSASESFSLSLSSTQQTTATINEISEDSEDTKAAINVLTKKPPPIRKLVTVSGCEISGEIHHGEETNRLNTARCSLGVTPPQQPGGLVACPGFHEVGAQTEIRKALALRRQKTCLDEGVFTQE